MIPPDPNDDAEARKKRAEELRKQIADLKKPGHKPTPPKSPRDFVDDAAHAPKPDPGAHKPDAAP